MQHSSYIRLHLGITAEYHTASELLGKVGYRHNPSLEPYLILRFVGHRHHDACYGIHRNERPGYHDHAVRGLYKLGELVAEE